MTRVVCRWDADRCVFVPLSSYAEECAKEFEKGERVVMETIAQRSDASHRHYFASIKEAWQNLPEDAAARYDTPEKLRKWALVKAGYHHETNFVLENADRASAVAQFMRMLDECAVVVQKGNVIRAYVAKSQSRSVMDKEEFQASKTAVLDILSGTIGVSRAELEKEGRADSKPRPAKRPNPFKDEPAPPDPGIEQGSIRQRAAAVAGAGHRVEPESHERASLGPGKGSGKGFSDYRQNVSRETGGFRDEETAEVGASQQGSIKEGLANKEADGGSKVKEPITAAEYETYAQAWIAEAPDKFTAFMRWDREKDLRERLRVPIKSKTLMQALISDKG